MKLTINRYPSSDNIIAFSTERGPFADIGSPYSGFSLCNYTGDAQEHIRECRDAVSRYLGIADWRLMVPHQTHSTNVVVVDVDNNESLEGVDGLVTKRPGVALAINTADCVAVLMADNAAGVIGAVHSGWRGTAGEIAGKCVDRMVSMGAEAARIMVWMGPAICSDCYEVGDDVANVFDAFPGAVIRCTGRKPHIDLGVAIRHTLEKAGIEPANISMPEGCSFCHPDRFFSARRLGVKSGRTLSVIMRKEI